MGRKWLPGKQCESVAQYSVKVKLTSDLVIHHHSDQIHKRTVDESPVESLSESDPGTYTYTSMNSTKPVASKTEQSYKQEVLRFQQLNSYHKFALSNKGPLKCEGESVVD